MVDVFGVLTYRFIAREIGVRYTMAPNLEEHRGGTSTARCSPVLRLASVTAAVEIWQRRAIAEEKVAGLPHAVPACGPGVRGQRRRDSPTNAHWRPHGRGSIAMALRLHLSRAWRPRVRFDGFASRTRRLSTNGNPEGDPTPVLVPVRAGARRLKAKRDRGAAGGHRITGAVCR